MFQTTDFVFKTLTVKITRYSLAKKLFFQCANLIIAMTFIHGYRAKKFELKKQGQNVFNFEVII